MFDPKKSKYRVDMQSEIFPGISHVRITPMDYTQLSQLSNGYVLKKYVDDNGIHLVRTFSENIDEDSLECFDVFGFDINNGLYYFGICKDNPELGLCFVDAKVLVDAIPSEFYETRTYLGAFSIPADYDEIFENGVPDIIKLDGTYRVLSVEDETLKKPESRLISDLYEGMNWQKRKMKELDIEHKERRKMTTEENVVIRKVIRDQVDQFQDTGDISVVDFLSELYERTNGKYGTSRSIMIDGEESYDRKK